MKKDVNYTWFDQMLASIIAFPFNAVIYIVLGLALKVIWPVLRFVFTALRSGFTRATGKLSIARPVVASMGNNLPTPDIFKGAPNLAPAKQLKL